MGENILRVNANFNLFVAVSVAPGCGAKENLTMVHVFISHIHEEAEIAMAIKRFLRACSKSFQ